MTRLRSPFHLHTLIDTVLLDERCIMTDVQENDGELRDNDMAAAGRVR